MTTVQKLKLAQRFVEEADMKADRALTREELRLFCFEYI
jgi:hypothetical protein